MSTTALFRPFRGAERPVTRRRPALELMEDRLAPSPTLPLPPPGPVTAVASFHPPDPCLSRGMSLHPPEPCIGQVPSQEPPDPCLT